MRMEHWFYTLPLRLRSLFRRRQVEQELDEELQYHLERKTDEYIAQGLSPEQARQTALRAMHGLTQRKEECRDTWQVNAIDETVRDLRYGARMLRRSPGFTLAGIVTLTLAISANAVVFGVLNGLILRPLDVPNAESLRAIQHGNEASSTQSYLDYLDLRDRNRSFEDLAAFNIDEVGLNTGENTAKAWTVLASGNYFDVLGMRPYLGRFFHRSDEHGPDSAPFIVLSYDYWHTHFLDDRSAVGRRVRVNKHWFTILGVAPPEFHGTLLFFFPDFWMPLVQEDQITGLKLLNDRGNRWVFMTFGHVRAGVTEAQATADLNSIGLYLEKTYPQFDNKRTFVLSTPNLYGDYIRRPARSFLTALMLLAGLILLAACTNLGGLFAARAADRSREVALRLALGSSRKRILQGLLTEAMLIALAGGMTGLLAGIALLKVLSVWRPVARFPIYLPVTPDAKVYAVAVALALLSGLLFGIVPVRQVLRTDPYDVVKSGSRTTGGKRLSMRELLIGVQIAICAVLVISSIVALRGLLRSMHSEFGFEPRNATVVETDLNMAGYFGEAHPAMQKRLLDAVERIPGVEHAGLVSYPPLIAGNVDVSHVFTEQAVDLRPSNAAAMSVLFSISPDYLRAAGTVLVAGRALTWHDNKDAPRVALINQEFARRIFGSVPRAIGKHYKMPDGARIEVVGIVEDGKYNFLAEDPRPAMFLPILQATTRADVVVRSTRDEEHLAIDIRNAIRKLDAALPVAVEPFENRLDLPLFPSRVATLALGVLGAMGAMLSVTGIFGMAAYSVSKRLKELGIRMALGAQRREVLQAALGRALRLLAFGSGAGLMLGIATSRLLASIVYQATPRDPLVLLGVVLVMVLLGLLGTWIPAQRALSLDTSRLLREE